jgi:hypothetical protein
MSAPSQSHWIPWRAPGFVVMSVTCFAGVALGFLVDPAAYREVLDLNAELAAHPVWTTLGGLCVGLIGPLMAYILLTSIVGMPPFFRWYFRLGMWGMPAAAQEAIFFNVAWAGGNLRTAALCLAERVRRLLAKHGLGRTEAHAPAARIYESLARPRLPFPPREVRSHASSPQA